MRRSAFFLVVLSALAASAASLPRPARAIVGGAPSDATDDAVVLVLTHVPAKDPPVGQYYENCTGTLLAPNLVLTARHCVTSSSDGMFRCNKDGTIEVGSGTGGQLGADFVPSDALVFTGPKLPAPLSPEKANAKGKAYVHDDATVTCNADVALIILDRALPNAKLAPIRLDSTPRVATNDTFTVVGWGATETALIPDGRMRRKGVTVVDVGPSDVERVGGTLGDKEFLGSESVCTGDSGGPAFAPDTGAVIGVVSRGENTTASTSGAGCVGTQHTFMQTASFRDLVMKAYTQAGAQPWLEGQPPPGSAPDAGASDDAGADADASDAPPPSGSSSGCTLHASRVGRDGSSTLAVALAIAAAGAATRAA